MNQLMRAVTSKVFATLLFTSIFWVLSNKALSQAHAYSPEDAKTVAPIANPERGFYKHYVVTFGRKSEPLNSGELEKLYTVGDEQANKKISLMEGRRPESVRHNRG
jgi:hypothetical protein